MIGLKNRKPDQVDPEFPLKLAVFILSRSCRRHVRVIKQVVRADDGTLLIQVKPEPFDTSLIEILCRSLSLVKPKELVEVAHIIGER